jgi:hypothetical protein
MEWRQGISGKAAHELTSIYSCEIDSDDDWRRVTSRLTNAHR